MAFRFIWRENINLANKQTVLVGDPFTRLEKVWKWRPQVAKESDITLPTRSRRPCNYRMGYSKRDCLGFFRFWSPSSVKALGRGTCVVTATTTGDVTAFPVSFHPSSASLRNLFLFMLPTPFSGFVRVWSSAPKRHIEAIHCEFSGGIQN